MQSPERSPTGRLAAIVLACAIALLAALAPAPRAQGVRPTPAEFRGSNYLPSTTLGIDNALNMLTAAGGGIGGTYSSSQVRSEIATLAKAGVNCVRIFPSFYGWLACPADYMANLKDLARHCRSRGIVITYVMWNTTSNVFAPMYFAVTPSTVAYDALLHQTLQQVASTYTLNASPTPYPVVLSFGEPWQFVLHDEPGNSLFMAPYHGVMSTWPNNLKQKCEAYVDAIGDFFANDPDGRAAYGSYDLFNEPDCCMLDLADQYEILAMTFTRLARSHGAPAAPRPEFTVGFANFSLTRQHHDALVRAGIKQTYLSYHCYEHGASFDVIAQSNADVGSQLGMTVVCSEFYDRNKPGHLGGLAAMIGSIDSRGIAGNVWGYLATNLIVPQTTAPPGTFIRFDGMVIPTAVPFTSFTSPLFFVMAPGADVDARALKSW